MSEHPRCDWCAGDELMQAYHDTEWRTPIRDDDRAQFEFLILEGAQAGLSWRTILHKRAGYRRAYEGFDPARVAGYGDAERDALLGNAEIVRNRLKVAASIDNAGAFLAVQEEFGSFCSYLWPNTPVLNSVPAAMRGELAIPFSMYSIGTPTSARATLSSGCESPRKLESGAS